MPPADMMELQRMVLEAVPPGADRGAAGAGRADAVGVNAHCAVYEGEAENVRAGEMCVVVGAGAHAGA